MNKIDILRNKLGIQLGFGTLRLPMQDKHVDIDKMISLVDYYISHGGKYFETAYSYFESEKTIRDLVVNRYKREQFLLADKMPISLITSEKEMEQIFSEQLSKLSVTYFDFYLLHNINEGTYQNVQKTNAIDFIKSKKEAGKIKYIGFSFHGRKELLEEILEKYNSVFDFVQLQINYLDWDSPVIQSGHCYKLAEKYGMPVFVMEPIKGGRLCDIPQNAYKYLGDEQPAAFALRWVSLLQNVVCILSGMNELNQVQENINALSGNVDNSITEKSELIRKTFADSLEIQCTQCGYCLEVCPKKIPIPQIFHLYEFDNRGHKGGYYGQICIGKGRAGDCVKCGRCETICSQRIEIRSKLQMITELYEKPNVRYAIKMELIKILKRLGLYYKLRRLKNKI